VVADQNFLPSSRKIWTSETDLDRQLKTDTVVATMARLDPASYTKLRNLFLDGARQGHGIAQMEADSRDFISDELMPSYYRRAPDDVLIRYQQIRLDAFRYLEQNAPAACVTIWAPKSSIGTDADVPLPKQINAQLDEAMAEVVTAAMLHPDHLEDDTLNRRASQNFWKTVLAKSPDYEKSLDALKKDKHNEVLYCRALELQVQTMLNQPPAVVARIVRGDELKPESNKPHQLAASH
jgi:hypothetical protein